MPKQATPTKSRKAQDGVTDEQVESNTQRALQVIEGGKKEATPVVFSTAQVKSITDATVKFDKADKAADEARWNLAYAVHTVVKAWSGSADALKVAAGVVKAHTDRLGKDDRTVQQNVSMLNKVASMYPTEKRFPNTSFEAHRITVGSLGRTDNLEDRETIRQSIESFRQSKESGKITVTEMADLVNKLQSDGKLKTEPRATRGRGSRTTETSKVDTQASLVKGIGELVNKLTGLVGEAGSRFLESDKLEVQLWGIIQQAARLVSDDARKAGNGGKAKASA